MFIIVGAPPNNERLAIDVFATAKRAPETVAGSETGQLRTKSVNISRAHYSPLEHPMAVPNSYLSSLDMKSRRRLKMLSP